MNLKNEMIETEADARQPWTLRETRLRNMPEFLMPTRQGWYVRTSSMLSISLTKDSNLKLINAETCENVFNCNTYKATGPLPLVPPRTSISPVHTRMSLTITISDPPDNRFKNEHANRASRTIPTICQSPTNVRNLT